MLDLRLIEISGEGRFLALSDDTRWMVADLDVKVSARWQLRERVAVSGRTADRSRLISNRDRRDEAVRAWAWGSAAAAPS
jgi:hypothetical protein